MQTFFSAVGLLVCIGRRGTVVFCFVLMERTMTSLLALPPVFGVAFDVEAVNP